MKRIHKLQEHLTNPTNNNGIHLNKVSSNKDDDIVIVSALRTPIGKAKRGMFKNITPDVLLSTVLRAVVKDSNIDPMLIGDIVVGNVLQPGSAVVVSRMAQMLAGIPYNVPLMTANRQCSSGLQSFVNVAAAIQAGYYDIGIAAGVESMTLSQIGGDVPDVDWEKVGENETAKECTTSMGNTSENVAEKYGVTRQQQDKFAVESHKKAELAQKNGYFDAEIVPVEIVTEVDGQEKNILVSKDEGVRPGTTFEGLSKLRPAFKEDGTTTAGNSSQVSDGAAAVLVTKRSVANRLGLKILGIFRSYAVVGVPPAIMGIGPAEAIPVALKKENLSIDDIGIFEINEAFASQSIYCIDALKIPYHKVNPKGGAIALGHPLGCTGTRQIATLLHELNRTKQRYGVVSMCIGTGMGAAAVFESP